MKKVVVLLPEGQWFDQLFSEGIAPAGTNLVRLDSEFSSESRLGTICNEIENADLVVADISGRNPNVMYQVGFAHGIGRKVLLLADHLENFPFDKTRHRVIGYGRNIELLKAELRAFLGSEGGEQQSVSGKENARDKFLSLFGDILAEHQYEHRGGIEQENPTTFVLLNQDMDLALVQALARRARELGFRLKLM